jgi:hypothetical protein
VVQLLDLQEQFIQVAANSIVVAYLIKMVRFISDPLPAIRVEDLLIGIK